LKKWKDEGALMGCSKSGGGVEHDQGMGILSGHAYGILDMREVKVEETEDMDALDGKFVQVRNPWGMREWKGDWCDNDVMWEDYPQVKELLNPGEFKNDGTFWIEYTDFKEQFNQLFICLDFEDSWQGKRFRGNWVPGDNKSGAGGMPKFKTFGTNPQYSFTVEEDTKAVFIVSQRDLRWQENNAKYKEAVGFVCMKLSGESKRAKGFSGKLMAGMSRTFAPMRQVAGQLNLKPGAYVLIPCTYKPSAAPKKFILEAYTSTPVKFDMEGDELPDLDEIEEEEAEEQEDLDDDTFEEEEEDEEEQEDDGRELAALAEQVGELSSVIRGLTTDIKKLEDKLSQLEN